ncbi:unnamed protein product [Cercopithifilaria johnstoni]|uniref:C2H2-type domain-containing protein n=1 Tax=Cercopithifilaria johnstoni TaxID=2874296 RepID=A0A8J2M3T6_9BILA|nr:unnamed protein product [Cercopithifilaria johnstoni]
MQHDKNATGTAGVSLSSIMPYDSFVQQQQQQQEPSSGSSLLPTRLISSKSSELLSSDGGDSPDIQDPLQQQQHQSETTQKLLVHLSSTISSGQVSHAVIPEQIYIAAAAVEEAKLLETRKQQLLQKLQQQLNSNKVSSVNGTANAAVAAQLWLQQSCATTASLQEQQQQQQQQLANKANQNQPPIILTNHSTTGNLISETLVQQQITALQQDAQEQQQQLQQTAFLNSDYQQLVQNGDLRLKCQNEQQSLSDSKAATVPQHHTLLSPHSMVHADDGCSAFRQPQRQQYFLDRNTDRGTTAITTVTRDCDHTPGFTVPSSSSSPSTPFVTSLPRNHITSVERDYHNREDNTESKLVISDIEMTDDYNKTDKTSGAYPVSKVSDERGEIKGQLLLTTGSSNEIIGISTYATVGAVIHADNDEFDEKMNNPDEQPRMKSILDFVNGEVGIDVEHKESDDDETVEKPIVDDDAGNRLVDDSDTRLLMNNMESPEIHRAHTGTPFEQTRFTAMRIEERILNEKLTPSTTSSTATSSGSAANTLSPCHRFVPQTVSTAPSPRSESVSSAPGSSTFCRAPGLGPVNTTETQQSGTSLPLVCNICGFSCNSKFHYNSHMNTHGDHQCTMCDYTSRTEGRLKKHMRDSHTVEEQLAAGLDVEQALTSSTSTSSTPVACITTTPVDGSNFSTSMASVLEAANLAAAAQAAAQAAVASCSSNSSSDPATSVPSDSSSGLSLPSGSGTPPSSDVISSSSLSSAVQSISGLMPSALDQIRAFTENPSVLPDLSSANLATALISQGLLSSQAFHESMKSINSDERSVSPVNGDKPRQCSSKPKTYKCKQCCHISTSKEEQWAHARTHIPVEKQLGCTRCGFVTEYKHHLEYHLRNHMGSKPFHCKKCAYSCVNKSMLNSHMKSHTNIYQFRCRDCTYATKYCHSLKLHLRKYNHNRATDVTDSAVSIAVSATAGTSNLCNGSAQAVTESDDTTMRRRSESLVVQSGDGSSPEPLPTTSTMAQELSAALGMTPVVTSNSLNIASHLLFRQQHQMEEMELLLRLKNMAGMNPGAILGISLQCPACSYQAINQSDSLRHQLGHLIGPNGENPLIPLYNIFGMPQTAGDVPSEASFESNSNLNEQMEQQDEEMEMEASKVDVDDFIGGAEVDEKPSIDDSEDHIMSDISGESQDSPSSGKSSIDEGSSGIEQESDKGAKKRKAGLKLNQIAARLQEKNSPENPGSSDSLNDSKYEGLLLSGIKENPMNEMSGTSLGITLESQEAPSISSLPSTTPLAPQPQIVPPLGMHNDLINLSNLNIFQQACIAHMQEMERKLHILEMWRFSCGHCKMAFQDEPLYHIHMGYHGYENPFKCNRCGQACSDFLTFNLHLLQAKH